MQQQWSAKDGHSSTATPLSTSGTSNKLLTKTFSMSVMELEQKLQERLRARAADLSDSAAAARNMADTHRQSNQLIRNTATGEKNDPPNVQQSLLSAHLLPRNVMEQLLVVGGVGRPPPKASCAWHSSAQRKKFQHLVDQPICTCGAGRDISFLHDSRRYMRPYAVEADVAKTALAEDNATSLTDHHAAAENNNPEREARVDEIRQHLADSFLPDEYQLVRSHGVEGLDIVESRFCTTPQAHKRHATAFPALIPTGRQQVRHLRQVMQNMLERLDFGAKLTNLKGPSVVHKLVELVKQEQSIYNLIFHELIRQCTVECVERGQLLADVRQQYADLLARVPEMLLGWHNEWLAQRALDRRLQEEVIHFKNELERLETELSRVDVDDTHLSQEAFQLRRTLCDEVKVSRDNAVQLSDYHELYELQRKRLEKQISDLVNERAAWIRAAYQLAIKYVDDRHLEPIHSLHLSHRSWFHLAKQIMQVYDVSERRDLADLSRVLSEDWTRHMQRMESRLLRNEVDITRELRRLQAEMLHLTKQIRFGYDDTDHVNNSAEKLELRKQVKKCIVSWSQTLFTLKMFISGEELSRGVRYVHDIELISETWVSLTITLFRRHYRTLSYPGQQNTRDNVDIYKDWKRTKSQKKKRKASTTTNFMANDTFVPSTGDEDDESEEVSDIATSTATVAVEGGKRKSSDGAVAVDGQQPENADIVRAPKKQHRYSMIEREHQQNRQRRSKRKDDGEEDETDDKIDDDKIFPLLSKDEWQDMVAQYQQFVPSNMRERAQAYFSPLQSKPEFAELYRIDVQLKNVLSAQRTRMSGDDGVGSSLQKIDDDIHYIEMMRTTENHDNNSVSEDQLLILRDRLPNWFGLCDTCLNALEKYIPVVEKSEKTKIDEKLTEEEDKVTPKKPGEEEVSDLVVSLTKSAELVERVKRWHTLVQLQLKARDESLHERLSEINQNMLRLLVDSIVLASMCGQEAIDGPMPNDQPEPDVLTAAAQVAAAANSPNAERDSSRGGKGSKKNKMREAIIFSQRRGVKLVAAHQLIKIGERSEIPGQVLGSCSFNSGLKTERHHKVKHTLSEPMCSGFIMTGKRDARLEMMTSFYSRAVWTHDEVADCSRALLHATDELEPDLLTGSKSVGVFRENDHHTTNDVVMAANGARLTTSPGGVRIDFDWAEREQLAKESDEWCRAMAVVNNVLSRTHKFPQFRMAVHTTKHNDAIVVPDTGGEGVGDNRISQANNNAEMDDMTFEEFTQRRVTEYEHNFRHANALHVRCLGDDDNVYVRKINLDGEVPAILATESAMEALKHARKLTLDTETRCKDAENRVTTLEGDLQTAQDTISDLKTELEIKSAELERLAEVERGSPAKTGAKKSNKHSSSKSARTGNKNKPITPTNLLAPSHSTQSATASGASPESMTSSPSPTGSRIGSTVATSSARASSSQNE